MVKSVEYQPSFEFRNRVEAVRTASNIIEDCCDMWDTRKPFHEEHFDEIKETLEKLEKDLNDIKELPLHLHPTTVDERIKYCESLIAIPKKYKKVIERYETRSRSPLLRRFRPEIKEDRDMYFIDFLLAIAGLDDLCYAVFPAEKVRNGELTLEKLKENDEERVVFSQKYIVERGELPDKRSREIANLTYSIFSIMYPITETDRDVIYEKLLIGHPRAWQTCYGRRGLIKNYLENLRRQHNGQDDSYLWVGQCFPRHLMTLAGPEINALIIRKRSKKEVERLYIA